MHSKWFQLNDDDSNDEKTFEVILEKAPLEDNFAYSSLLFWPLTMMRKNSL